MTLSKNLSISDIVLLYLAENEASCQDFFHSHIELLGNRIQT